MTSNGHILQWDILPLLCYGQTVKLRESFTCIALLDDKHRCTHQIGPQFKSQARDLAYGSFPRRSLNDLQPDMITDEHLNELIDVLLCKTSGHRKNDGVRKKALERCRDILKVKIEGQNTKKQHIIDLTAPELSDDGHAVNYVHPTSTEASGSSVRTKTESRIAKVRRPSTSIPSQQPASASPRAAFPPYTAASSSAPPLRTNSLLSQSQGDASHGTTRSMHNAASLIHRNWTKKEPSSATAQTHRRKLSAVGVEQKCRRATLEKSGKERKRRFCCMLAVCLAVLGLIAVIWLYMLLDQSECTGSDMWRGICGFMVAPIETFKACIQPANNSSTYHDSL